MDGVREFLESLRRHRLEVGRLRAILHICIGRKITRAEDGAVLSAGVTWREMSNLLKQLRWETDQVKELGIDPADLPPRDRQRFWYGAIARAGVDTAEARDEGDKLAKIVEKIGFTVSAAPGG